MSLLPVVLGLSLVWVACGGATGDGSGEGGQNGAISFYLETADDDVAGFLFEVRDPSGIPVDARYVLLEEMDFPARLLEGAGTGHRFADAYFVLEPGDYVAQAFPMVAEGQPSRDCAPSEPVQASVAPGETEEVFLISHCDTEDNPGLDVVVVLQHDPRITDLVFDPSKFVLTCESLDITVVAHDPDEDPIEITWDLVAAPAGAIYDFEPDGPVLHFMSRTEGDYVARVTVCDSLGLCASLTFPIHAVMSTDDNGNGIGDECEDRSGKVVTILLTMSNPRIGDDEIPERLAAQSVDWASPVALPLVLVVLDDNHHGEFAQDAEFVRDILIGAGYPVDFLEEPAGGLTPSDLEGYDVVWFSNPGHPLDDNASALALLLFLEAGGGVVLQGDDISSNPLLGPLTHLSYIDNGTSYCGAKIDNNAHENYLVSVVSDPHPVITGLEGRSFLYGDDIDTAAHTGAAGEVLAWTVLDPGRCHEPCDPKPVVVAFDPAEAR